MSCIKTKAGELLCKAIKDDFGAGVDFQFCPVWVAEVVGFTAKEFVQAAEDLIDCGVLERKEDTFRLNDSSHFQPHQNSSFLAKAASM